MQANETAGAKTSPAIEQKIRPLEATFRNILWVVSLIFIFAVALTLILWAVCDSGMKTATTLEHGGLPMLSNLASLQEDLAVYRLNSYEYLFARENEKSAKANTAEILAARMRWELKAIKVLLPAGEGRRLASNLESAIDGLDSEFRKVRSLVDTDFASAMTAMDHEIPPRTDRVTAAADALKEYGYRFSGGQASATFASFVSIKNNAIIFGVANILIAFGAVVFVRLAASRSRAQLLDTLARLDERTREVEKTHGELLLASRQAGMAEIATNVLHNIGNVLNSVNISASLVADSVKKSKAANLAKVAAMLREHAHDLGAFITADAKGKQLPAYLSQLSEQLLADQQSAVAELGALVKNIEHIKDIVAMQQSYARVSGVRETIDIRELVEDSLRMNESALGRHRVEVVRDFERVPAMNAEKHKILQILVNLIRNAKYACDDSQRADKRMTVRVTDGDGRVKISVIDNGVGIPPENMTRIFSHGFTTRKDGHGFGLHSGALAAQEMGGSLNAQSEGTGHGATFTLDLPCNAGEEAHE
jgi:signal transduction histidine kinase